MHGALLDSTKSGGGGVRGIGWHAIPVQTLQNFLQLIFIHLPLCFQMAHKNPKLLSLTIFKTADGQKPVMLSSALDVSSFGWMERSGVGEFLVFASRTLAERVGPGLSSVMQEQYLSYCYKDTDGMACVLMCEEQYPKRAAISIITETLREYKVTYQGRYERATADNCISAPELQQKLTRYQDPLEADKLLKIEKELEETKCIMYSNIDALLARGEKIDDLVAKTNDLSTQTKGFYKTSKKLNRTCPCLIM